MNSVQYCWSKVKSVNVCVIIKFVLLTVETFNYDL